MPKEKPIGVYSTEKSSYVGMGATRRKVVNKRLWMIWEYDESAVMVQSLNQNLIAYGQRRVLSMKEFEQNYTREKEYFIDKTTLRPIWRPQGNEAAPEDAAAPQDAQSAAEHPPAGEPGQETELPDARKAGKTAASEDEPGGEIERISRAAFGVGLTHLKRGNLERAKEIFEDLALKPGDYQRQHKHMFNEFGIGLRKSKLLDVALKHYIRALGLSPEDENLYHNLARVYYEQGNMEKALESLDKSLALNPDLKESQLFKRFIAKKKKRNWNLKFDL